MSNTTVIKAAWMNKFSRGLLGDKWKMVYVRLYNGGKFCWFSNEHNMEKRGAANLKHVQAFIAMGDYVKQVPDCPRPAQGGYDTMLAFPEKPKRTAKTYFFATNNVGEMTQWSQAISSCLNPPATQVPPTNYPPMQAPPTNYPPQTGYPTGPPAGPMGAQPPSIGFNMPMPGGDMGDFARPPPHAPGYNPQAPSSGPSYGPRGPTGGSGYGAPPPTGPCYPTGGPAPTPGYGAPAPGYGAPAPGYGAPAPGYGAPAPGYGAPAPGYGGPAPSGYPQGQHVMGAAIPQASGSQGYVQPNVQYVQTQKQKKKGGMGKIIAGVAGGALAGYAVQKTLGGGMFGHGMGWGGSWSSHSWSSCSGGSFGSFGSFGGCSD